MMKLESEQFSSEWAGVNLELSFKSGHLSGITERYKKWYYLANIDVREWTLDVEWGQHYDEGCRACFIGRSTSEHTIRKCEHFSMAEKVLVVNVGGGVGKMEVAWDGMGI